VKCVPHFKEIVKFTLSK